MCYVTLLVASLRGKSKSIRMAFDLGSSFRGIPGALLFNSELRVVLNLNDDSFARATLVQKFRVTSKGFKLA